MTGVTAILAQASTTQPVVEENAVLSFVESLRLGTLADTPWTGWLILLLGILAGFVAGKLSSIAIRHVGQRLIERGWAARGTTIGSAAGPANLGLITAGLAFGLTGVILSPELREFSFRVLALLYLIAATWFLYNLVDLVDVALRRLVARTRSKLDDQMVPLIRKTLRVFVLVVFALAAADNVFGADIGAWLAGLGIAGLAVSLAAQDSIKNFFGSITILMDRPFAQGDFINLGGQTGTVEEIGFRSTRLRMLSGNLLTIPNSKIVDSSVENITRRPHIRRDLSVTVTYDTPPEKIEQAVRILRDILAEPEIAAAFDLVNFPPRVYFDQFNADSLNLKVAYWFRPGDYWPFIEHCHKVNLRVLREFNAAGIDFAFPTRTLYLAGDPRRHLAMSIEQPRSGDGAVGGTNDLA